MKNNIFLGAALTIISLTNLAAQDSIQLNTNVSRSFKETFQGAEKIRWASLRKGITKAQFYHDGNSCVAYFDEEGALITSGRKIRSVKDLPIKVQTGLTVKKNQMEKKLGALSISHIFEMIKADMTTYYVSLYNNRADIFLSVNTSGFAVVEKKTIKKRDKTEGPKDVIAKKN